MQRIMDVFDVFEVPNRGVVVGGVNCELDALCSSEIRRLIGQAAELRNPNGSVVSASVVDVEASNSLTDQKNIFVLLPADTMKDNIDRETVVYILDAGLDEPF